MTTAEISTMANCDRPLETEERKEMSAERQWGTLELMGPTKKADPTTEVGDERAAKSTAISKPPPAKAPTYAMGPSSRSQNSLGGKKSKGDSKWKYSQ